MPSRMYSPSSPVLSSLDQHVVEHNHNKQEPSQCLRFKYFTTFLISTTCLALLSASLATHKWIVSKPIRILKLNGGQTNFTSLMLTAQSDQFDQDGTIAATNNNNNNNNIASNNGRQNLTPQHSSSAQQQFLFSGLNSMGRGETNSGDYLSSSSSSSSSYSNGIQQNNKFQGEIYFGLFKGVKVLNHGFGSRISPISVLQAHFSNKDSNNQQQQQELVNFKSLLVTLASVVLAIIFALIGSIFAIINFVMTPRETLTGPVGLVIWNATACFSCLLAMVTWLIEYFVRLQANVLTFEEVQNGWTSENRSQFGYSYYFVVLAFVLHLVNIFIVSIVQFETWTNSKAAKRQTRSACEGVIMLY